MAAAWRLILLGDLIREWQRRLGELHEAIADAWGGDRWLSEIRARVLTFLVARYGERAGTADQQAPIGRVEEPRESAYCIVEPGDHPPRARDDMRELLVDIRRQNVGERRRWRFWP